MTDALWGALIVFHVVVFTYFVLLNGYYLVMSIYAFRRLRRYIDRVAAIDLEEIADIAELPPVTLIIPAYNEESTIMQSSRSFLQLNYPRFEVIIVNDGSSDRTLDVLRQEYDLEVRARFPTAEIPSADVRGIYQSTIEDRLWVIDKENGGRSDAQNAAINYCRTPLFCATDADTILEEDSILRIVRPFLEDERTVASGGIIRIANGCTVKNGRVTDIRMPKSWLARFQVLEYLRSFLAGRVGWDALGIMFLISGAFGMFRRELVAELGGLDSESIGEDLELTVRMHKYHREKNLPYRISFVPDPVAWTEAPDTVRVLGRQRDRWQRGLMDTMFMYRSMLLNPRYGRIGLVAYPYFFFFEMLGPVIEFTGYIVFVVMAALGLISWPFAIAFLLVAIILGTAISILSVGLEEMSFRRYTRVSDLMKLFALALIENLGYRQLQTLFRIRGMISFMRGEKGWGQMERKGFQEAAS